ncbi:peptidoglycan-binding protein [Streptomyces poriticola]|uniref:peptidoglycan-binding protein n=1 Tax=Streptomyces poriticola TaxID=3120506 RepID=UPI002FCE4FAD
MSRWKGLPADLDPRTRRLVVRLRRAKDHSGLSMRQLAAKTGFSAKSWERYLSGRTLPPREAVEAVARLGGDDPTRLLALHEVAAAARADRRESAAAETSEPLEPPGAPGPPPRGRLRRRPRYTVLCTALAALVLAAAVPAAVLLAQRSDDGPDATGPAARATTPAPGPASAASSPVTYTCAVQRIDGRWYAGNSRTRDAIVAYGHAGPEVAEVQCLLRRAGLSPGEVDGIFGPLTQRAVKQIQQRDGLVVDGIVGPHTWKALRG